MHGICITYHIIHIHIYLHIAFLLWNVAFPQSFRQTALSPLSPKVMACAGGPNALAAISLSRGTLVFTPCIDTHLDTYTHRFDSCLALFLPTHYAIKVKVNVYKYRLSCINPMGDCVCAPANDMIMNYNMVTITIWIT